LLVSLTKTIRFLWLLNYNIFKVQLPSVSVAFASLPFRRFINLPRFPIRVNTFDNIFFGIFSVIFET